jgi:hypothetical protein
MAQFGWAYINCTSSSTITIGGPEGSVQFLSTSSGLSGSENLIYNTSSNTLFITGTLLVSGTISASSFVVNQTDTISGSTIFGNSSGDTHKITGSLFVGAGAPNKSVFQVDVSNDQSTTLGLRVNYRTIAASGLTSSTGDYILGFGGSGNIEFRLLSASTHNSGAILVLKDELSSRTGAVTISASAPNTIDNNGAYVLTGSNPAISLYSNGANWFVF